MDIFLILFGLYLIFIQDQAYFYLIEKWYCRKYYKKDRSKCKCWSCRFYDDCVNSKEGD